LGLTFTPPAEGFAIPNDDREFLTYMDSEGRALCRGRRSWMSFLPEFARREVHRLAGCASVHEYAAKAAGVSPRSVREVLALEERIRSHSPLERLFHAGASFSKLEEVAPHTRDHQDARKFARWIEDGCTVKQIRARLVAQGYRKPAKPRLVLRSVVDPEPMDISPEARTFAGSR
jgi:hypothetical protein